MSPDQRIAPYRCEPAKAARVRKGGSVAARGERALRPSYTMRWYLMVFKC